MSDRNIKEHPPDTQPSTVDPQRLACRIFSHSDALTSSRDARVGPSLSLTGSPRSFWRPPRSKWSLNKRRVSLHTSPASSTVLGGRFPLIRTSNSAVQVCHPLQPQLEINSLLPTRIPLEKRIRSPDPQGVEDIGVQTEFPMKRKVTEERGSSYVGSLGRSSSRGENQIFRELLSRTLTLYCSRSTELLPLGTGQVDPGRHHRV